MAKMAPNVLARSPKNVLKSDHKSGSPGTQPNISLASTNYRYEPDVAHLLRWRSARGDPPDDSLGIESIEKKRGRVAARCYEGAMALLREFNVLLVG